MDTQLKPVIYCVITPVRNEARNLTKTIESLAAQTITPAQWIIVNDGSTDGTDQLADNAAHRYAWITVVHRQDRGFRKPGGGVIEAFYDGYKALRVADWEFLVKLDGDISLDPEYFERCFHRFASDQHLGIGGGTVCVEDKKKLLIEADHPRFHVRGATKIYRRALWDCLGELLRAPGWDTLDEVKANMLGWKTYSFPDIMLVHHRRTGAADGAWNNAFKNGLANYISGYHPLFMLVKCLRRALLRFPRLEALGIFSGYLSGYFRRLPQVEDRELVSYLRREQMRKLLLRPSIWS